MAILKSIFPYPSRGKLDAVGVYDAFKAVMLILNALSATTPATTGVQAVTMPERTESLFTITPTGACTFNASGGSTGSRVTFIITTSGVASYNLTFGTNFKSQGVLATGAVSGKVFTVSFVCQDGTTWCEIARTTAM